METLRTFEPTLRDNFRHSNSTQLRSGDWLGIATKSTNWKAYITSTSFSQYPLLYYGTNTYNFSDFVSFGGWTKPSVKVFSTPETFCSVSANYVLY